VVPRGAGTGKPNTAASERSVVSRDWGGADGEEVSLTASDGSFDRERVVAVASSVLDRWERDRHLDVVRGRVRNLFVVSLVVLAATWVFDPSGLTGLLFQAWWLASLPLAAVTGTVYATLRNPKRARQIWWDDGTLVTLGLVLVAVLARAATSGPYGRVAWQLLFAENSPIGVDYGYDVDDAVDETRVAELRGYANWVVLGSVAVVLLDGAWWVLSRGGLDAILAALAGDGTGGSGAGGAGGGGLPSLPALPGVPTDPLSVVGLLVAAVVVGTLVGLLVGVQREL
jgi:hypothetical protein